MLIETKCTHNGESRVSTAHEKLERTLTIFDELSRGRIGVIEITTIFIDSRLNGATERLSYTTTLENVRSSSFGKVDWIWIVCWVELCFWTIFSVFLSSSLLGFFRGLTNQNFILRLRPYFDRLTMMNKLWERKTINELGFSWSLIISICSIVVDCCKSRKKWKNLFFILCIHSIHLRTVLRCSMRKNGKLNTLKGWKKSWQMKWKEEEKGQN